MSNIADFAVLRGGLHNRIIITDNAVWRVPVGVSQIRLSACAAGGDGTYDSPGFAGDFIIKKLHKVEPNQPITIIVGKGNTIIGDLYTLIGASITFEYVNEILGFQTGIRGKKGCAGAGGRAASQGLGSGGTGGEGGYGGYGGAFGFGGDGGGGGGGGGGAGIHYYTGGYSWYAGSGGSGASTQNPGNNGNASQTNPGALAGKMKPNENGILLFNTMGSAGGDGGAGGTALAQDPSINPSPTIPAGDGGKGGYAGDAAGYGAGGGQGGKKGMDGINFNNACPELKGKGAPGGEPGKGAPGMVLIEW